MKKNKGIFIGIGFFICLVGIICFLFTKQDKDTSFTILEKQWLDNNKSKVIDISILKDIPIINYNGDGILFDFINDFEEVTGLDFNPIAYSSNDEIKSDYSFQVVTSKGDNDILVYSDSYALLSSSNVKYNMLSEISDITVGVLESDLDRVSNVMDDSSITFKTFGNIDELVSSIKPREIPEGTDVSNMVDAIVLPKIRNLGLIISNDNLNISYNINEIREDYVIHLGNDEKLNEIISKYFKKWQELKYDDSFGTHFSNNYFSFSNVDDKGKAFFKSKRYVYGYVDNSPYDLFVNDDLYGINKSFLSSFSNLSDIDIEYKKFSNISSLVDEFNNGSVDIIFDDLDTDFSVSNVSLVSNYDEQVTVLARPTNKVTVSSIKSLIGYDVATIGNTKVSSYLSRTGVSVTEYDSISDLLDKVKDDSIIVLDSEVYNYYSNDLGDYKAIYTFGMDDQYSFKVLDNSDNSIFIKFFNFYLSFISNQELANIGFSEVAGVSGSNGLIKVIIFIVSLLLIGLIGLLIYQNRKSLKDKISSSVSKDSRFKYIDILTSLKNRNYLNDNIDAWDESLVYPQGIIIVDLNNIAYINDNYGHAEGDTVIKEAANILIKTQISNSEIMRTNGNEFLIYTVGYDEKQIVSYIRKLNKEFKDLSHSFGAAIGYSIITDEIKTIDDAINEATLDMRNVKNEIK